MLLCIGKAGLNVLISILPTKFTKNTDIIYKTNIRWLWEVGKKKAWGPEKQHGCVRPGFSFCFIYYARLSARQAGNSEMPTGIDKKKSQTKACSSFPK